MVLMVLVVLILVLYSIAPIQTWDITENDHYDILETWGYSRVKRKYKVQEKFDMDEAFACEDMYKTEKTPFVAIILYKTSGRYMCLGSIVDRYHILSAKRCFDKVDMSDMLILVGYFKAYWGKNSQVKKIDRIIRHDYMIALARLKNPITFTKYIKPTRLPASFTKVQADFQKAFPPPYKLVGFDVDRYDIPGEFISKDMTYEIKEDKLVAFDECKKNYSRIILEQTKLFCTMGNATYCWGGWGGPVLKWMKELYYLQVGIIVADNCTFDTTGPFLAARTDSFSDWIRTNSFQEKKPR